MSIIHPGIASLTCDRVDLFTRSLSSITGHLRKNGYDRLISAFDDSESVSTRNEKRRITGELHDRLGVHSAYIGLDEKNAFLGILKESLPYELHDSAQYLLSGDPGIPFCKGPGANRNAVLSAFAGKRFISIDDDMLFEPRMLPGSSQGITVNHDSLDLEAGFFPDIKSIEKITELFTGDLLKYYDSITGAETGAIAPGSAPGRVMASMSGFYGGRWSPRPFMVFFIDGRMRDSACSSPAVYKKIKYQPFGYLQSPGIVISRSLVFFGGSMGVDASSTVPPFFPQVRGEDSLWAGLLQFYNENYLIASFPFALCHDWSEKKSFTEKEFKNTGADLGLVMLLLFSILSGKTECKSGDDPFACFGKALVELSEMPHNKWLEMCRSIWFSHVGNTVKSLGEMLIKYDHKPEFWAKDVNTFLDRIRSQSMDVESFVPRELHAAGTPEAAGRVHRKMLFDYGMLLVNWSRIWDEILRINAAGKGLLGEYYNKLL